MHAVLTLVMNTPLELHSFLPCFVTKQNMEAFSVGVNERNIQVTDLMKNTLF